MVPLPHHVEIRDAPEKGLGLFAKRDFRRGDVVFEEIAMFFTTDAQTEPHSQSLQIARSHDAIADYHDVLLERSKDHGVSFEHEELVRWLQRNPEIPGLFTVADIRQCLETNEMGNRLSESSQAKRILMVLQVIYGARMLEDISDGRYKTLGFAFHCSLMNHGCIPNAIICQSSLTTSSGLDSDTGTVQVRAIGPIKEGEEVTVSYVRSLYSGPNERRRHLLEGFGFECRCSSCKDETPALRGSLETLSTAVNLFFDNRDSPGPELYQLAWEIIVMAGTVLWDDYGLLLVFEELQACSALVDDFVRARHFASMSHNWCRMMLPEDHPRLIRQETLVESLESQGFSSIPMSYDNISLVFMLDHATNDRFYHFLRNEDGILRELPRDHSRALYIRGLEKSQKSTCSGLDSDALADAALMFAEATENFEKAEAETRAEAAYASLLHDLAAEEQSAREPQPGRKNAKTKKKNRRRRPQSPIDTEAQSTADEPTADLPAQGQPTSASSESVENAPQDATVQDERMPKNGL